MEESNASNSVGGSGTLLPQTKIKTVKIRFGAGEGATYSRIQAAAAQAGFVSMGAFLKARILPVVARLAAEDAEERKQLEARVSEKGGLITWPKPKQRRQNTELVPLGQ